MLHERMATEGRWLFRWRGILPFLVVPLLAIAYRELASVKLWSPWLAEFMEQCAFATCLAGLALRCLVVGYAAPGTSGRNTREQRADTLNTTGVYSLVRHPLYLANYLVVLGILLQTNIWWLIVIVSLAYALYYERIMMAEEAFLAAKFGDGYKAWAARTPLIVPRLRGWIPSERRFSWRRVLRSEYTCLLLIGVSLFLVEWLEFQLDPEEDPVGGFWSGFAVLTILAFLVLRTIKKKTRWLSD